MKLPAETLSREQQLEEFDVWITPYLGDVRKSVQFADRHAATVRAFDRLCQATNDFATEADLTHAHLAENLVKLFPGKSEEEVQRILMDLAHALFLISGKAGNSAKCQFPLFLKSKLKRLTIPKAKVTTKNKVQTRTVEQKSLPRTIVISTYMGWVADLHHLPRTPARPDRHVPPLRTGRRPLPDPALGDGAQLRPAQADQPPL
jgi:hypothetical protein